MDSTMAVMSRARYLLVCLPLLLGGCEPERGIRASQDFASQIDVVCVDGALRNAFEDVGRMDYVSGGGTFPKGVRVTQISYFRFGRGVGEAKLEIGSLGGSTRVSHAFTAAGAELPQAAFPPAMEAMAEASTVLKTKCGLNLSGMKFREIGQDVEALH
jgi:hypothetical protein